MVLAAVAAAAALAWVGCTRPLPPRLVGGTELRLEITRDGTLLVPVTVYDAAGRAHAQAFVVDTGASITSLTPAAADALGLARGEPITINAGADEIAAFQTDLPGLAIGAARFDGVRIAVLELPEARRLGVSFAGVLGLDLLGRYDVEIDLARRRFALHPSGAAAMIARNRAMAQLPIERGRYGLVVLTARIEGYAAMPAILDLGAQWTVINRSAARSMTGFAIQGVTPVERTRYARLALADLAIDHRGFQVENLSVFRRLGVDGRPAMLLGADVFEGRSVVLAYRDRALYVSR